MTEKERTSDTKDFVVNHRGEASINDLADGGVRSHVMSGVVGTQLTFGEVERVGYDYDLLHLTGCRARLAWSHIFARRNCTRSHNSFLVEIFIDTVVDFDLPVDTSHH